MRGLPQSKKVSWASDVNLCQVKLFLSEESPSEVGLGAQDHLQAKASWPHQSTGMGFGDNLPPGFEGAHPANLLKNKLSQIPVIRWKCPPRFVLNFTWQVVAGEESKEVEVQNHREMRLLEAVYPRASAIPPNPSLLMGIEDSHQNDQDTPLVPITPIEDEEAAADASVGSVAPSTVAMISHPPYSAPEILPASQCSINYPNPSANGNPSAGMVIGMEPNIAASAYAAMAANDERSFIDRDLLIQILSNQNLIEKLVTDHGPATKLQTIQNPSSAGIILSDPPSVHVSRTEAGAPSLAVTPSAPFYPPLNRAGPVSNPQPPPEIVPLPSPPAGAHVAKDINYYKSLIQQHGGEKQDILPQSGGRHNQLLPSPESINNPKPRDLKPKIMKPCIYFNSSRGCRHGANCSYQHDVSSAPQRVSGMPEVQSAKRMKVDREIAGT
ncbi:zinc finger CCCH domain-containing protein 6-like isoform X1 [Cornus florida]|uniref:zinc finger CCCH domain-containing protein 6-like isoform X1 n=2 Tax=Cornus florida TaxID=4283 RepID=UPI0028A05800|nr:zinc finger CCCH domain-containing protein 6-like isoform X1 [Cornus florida]